MNATHRPIRRTGLAVLVATAALIGLGSAGGAAATDRTGSGGSRPAVRPTVVLVHGAWADSGSWDGVVRRLQSHGYPVRVFPTPLRSLAGDTTALREYLSLVQGPIVLVGHSYGGAVITDAAPGNPSVKALVYVDAFAPAEGQRVLDLPGPNSALAAGATNPAAVFDVVPDSQDATADLYVRQDLFASAVANDLPRRRADVLAGSYVVRVRSGHLPMISVPSAVTATIERAACATA